MFEESYNSIIWGLSPMLLIVGLIYHVISFSWPYWMEDKYCHMGLWSYKCENRTLYNTLSHDLDSMSTWYHATQACEVLALLCAMMCVFTGLLRVNRSRLVYQKICAMCALLAGIFSLVGCLVFRYGQPRPLSLSLSWAFVMNIVSGCFCTLASPILYLDVRWHV